MKLAHPSPGLIIKNEALLYVEERLEFVLRMLCTDQPSKIVDVENRIRKLFPIPLNQMSIDHARSTLEKGKKKQQFPTVELRSIIQKEYFPADRDLTLTCYVCAVLEVIATDILKVNHSFKPADRFLSIVEVLDALLWKPFCYLFLFATKNPPQNLNCIF